MCCSEEACLRVRLLRLVLPASENVTAAIERQTLSTMSCVTRSMYKLALNAAGMVCFQSQPLR
jgi:hypothetical protein